MPPSTKPGNLPPSSCLDPLSSFPPGPMPNFFPILPIYYFYWHKKGMCGEGGTGQWCLRKQSPGVHCPQGSASTSGWFYILCQEETNTDTSSVSLPPRELLSSGCYDLEMKGCYGLERGTVGGECQICFPASSWLVLLYCFTGQREKFVTLSPSTSHLVVNFPDTSK